MASSLDELNAYYLQNVNLPLEALDHKLATLTETTAAYSSFTTAIA